MIEQAVARALLETLVNDKVFGKTIQIIYDTFSNDPRAKTVCEALVDRIATDQEPLQEHHRIPRHRIHRRLVLRDGIQGKRTPLQEDIN